MSKRLLIDFSNDIAVVFFEHKGQTYTSAFNNKHDLWAFLQQAPKAIAASVASANARRSMHTVVSERRLALDEASRVLASMPNSQVKFMSGLDKRRAQAPINFNPEELDF